MIIPQLNAPMCKICYLLVAICRISPDQEQLLLDFLGYPWDQDERWQSALLAQPLPAMPPHIPLERQRLLFDKRRAVYYKQHACPDNSDVAPVSPEISDQLLVLKADCGIHCSVSRY